MEQEEQVHLQGEELMPDSERANKLLTVIVNRAAAYDGDKMKGIALHLTDTPESFVSYHVCYLLNTFKGTPIYIRGFIQPYYFNRKMKAYQRIFSKARWQTVAEKKEVIYFDLTPYGEEPSGDSSRPRLFHGIAREDIFLIADEIYSWRYSHEYDRNGK